RSIRIALLVLAVHSRYQALPGNALPARLRLAPAAGVRPLRFGQAEPARQRVTRRSLVTRACAATAPAAPPVDVTPATRAGRTCWAAASGAVLVPRAATAVCRV